MWCDAIEEAIINDDVGFFENKNIVNIRHQDGSSLLHISVRLSKDRMVRFFLEKGLGESAGLANDGESVMHVAVRYYKYSIVEILLNNNVPINDTGAVDYTPLHLATDEYGDKYVNAFPEPDIIYHLLSRGAEVNVPTKNGDSPLFSAIHTNAELLVILYLERGANLNSRNALGLNPLEYAAERSNSAIVELLLNAGADVNSVTEKGRTPLHLAAASAFSEKTVQLLITRGANVNAEDKQGRTPIFMAIGGADDDDDPIIDPLEADDDENGEDEVPVQNPLIKQKIYNITRILMDHGADVNKKNNVGEPAFHRAIFQGIDEVIELFLERGVDVHAIDQDAYNSLHFAVERASLQVAETLIDRGVSVNQKNEMGTTPLHHAAHDYRVEHVKLLVSRGADVNATDVSGFTPLHYAARGPLRNQDRVPSIVNDILQVDGADPLAKNIDGASILADAVDSGNQTLIATLLRHLAYVHALGDSRAPEVAAQVKSAVGEIEMWSKHYETCQGEMVQMKKEMINGRLSYFDMITTNLETFVRNEEFIRAFVNNENIREFIFYEKLHKRFNIAVRRKVLTGMAVEHLSHMLTFLPIPMIESILSSLKLDELDEFVTACEAEYETAEEKIEEINDRLQQMGIK